MQDLNTLPLDENIYSAVKTLAGTATVKAALEQCVSEAEFAKAGNPLPDL